jgi:hypothetical protein
MIPFGIISLIFSSNTMLMNIASIPFTTFMTALIVALMSANMLQAYTDIFGDSDAPAKKETEFLM